MWVKFCYILFSSYVIRFMGVENRLICVLGFSSWFFMTIWIDLCILWFISLWYDSTIISNLLNWFICHMCLACLIRINVLCFDSIFIWISMIQFKFLPMQSWIDSIFIWKNHWIDPYVHWTISIFIASDLIVFKCLNRFILSENRFMSLYLPIKLHLLLMSIYSFTHTLKFTESICTYHSKLSNPLSTFSWD